MLDQSGNHASSGSQGASPTLANTARALWALAYAATWDATHHVLLKRRQLLLTDHSRALLRILIDTSLENHEIADAENWRQYLSLLEDARIRDLESAWQDFVNMQNQAIDALEALTSAATYQEQRAILVQEASILLTDTARVILRGSLSKQLEEHNDQVAKQLERFLWLLEDAQVLGIDVAWNRHMQP